MVWTGSVMVVGPALPDGTNAVDAGNVYRYATYDPAADVWTVLPGTARFYRALEGGEVGLAGNPFFYVSSSVWNLYDVFAEFLEINGLPTGPLILRDLDADDAKWIKSGHEHKLAKIERILAICRRLPFVLIGDAGQDDPAIYREVARRNPGRVLVYSTKSPRLGSISTR